MNAACMPNGAATRFVPGSGIILQSSVLPPTLAHRGRQFAAGFLQAPPHSAVPPCALVPSIRLYGSASLTVRANHGGGLISRRKRQTKKPRREGPTARRGVVGPRRKRGSPFHQADLRHALIKGGGCRYDSRLWNPQIALTTLMSGHAVSYVGQAGGRHLSSTFCAAPPATSNQHG
jgi:hypothetical protein